jgi:hypothetical protein
MFLSFRHKRPQKPHIDSDAQDKIVNSIVHMCIKEQQRCSIFMQRQTQRLSLRIKKFLLVMFLLLSSGYSFYLIAENLISYKSKAFFIEPIKIPKHTCKSGNENIQPDIAVTTEEYLNMQRFQHCMDSLGQTPSGKKVKDSILLSRPGLMDSIHFIENIYLLQSSKK